jgi:hypothetical protein
MVWDRTLLRACFFEQPVLQGEIGDQIDNSYVKWRGVISYETMASEKCGY